jgi:AraC-like DNA-binding protein
MRKTVARFADGDIADVLLRDFRIASSVLCRSVMAPPWGFGIPARQTGSFHVVLEGGGWLDVEGAPEQIRVEAGDLVVLPHGDAHRVRDAHETDAPPLNVLLDQHQMVDGELRFGGNGAARTEIVCGVFTLEHPGTLPWFPSLLPAVIANRGAGASDWRSAVASVLRDEARAPTRRGAGVVDRLLESLLADALRAELVRADTAAPEEALVDGRIGMVLSRLHANPELRWTVQDLASSAVMSRSAFSDRFRSLVGEPPIRYLTEVRLARAARLFRSTDATIAEVARSVGYASEAALSRAFKVRFGESPSAFRDRTRHGADR